MRPIQAINLSPVEESRGPEFQPDIVAGFHFFGGELQFQRAQVFLQLFGGGSAVDRGSDQRAAEYPRQSKLRHIASVRIGDLFEMLDRREIYRRPVAFVIHFIDAEARI